MMQSAKALALAEEQPHEEMPNERWFRPPRPVRRRSRRSGGNDLAARGSQGGRADAQ
ncbi:hypothetical protein ACLF3G_21655 [Falsiroseomonas sp. HC035]|uniref:hypothetical protein n=1 Tax=Falsiroseomonas sp. HC035 TaxID=3390999 RepID=UPI003D324186